LRPTGVIVVDTSALVEIALDGPLARHCRQALLDAEGLLMSAGTLTEVLIVSLGRADEPQMRALLDRFGLTVIAVTEERARATAQAYRRYGKGWHAASLNFGDCFAYALAKEHGCPLLFVGSDFAMTDVESALL
jgi:ribonuclease VapC